VDISKWSSDEILRLPDYVFGRRFPIFCSLKAGSATWVCDISEVGFPDRCVLWQVSVWAMIYGSLDIYVRMGLSDSVAVDDAEFLTFMPLLHGFGFQGDEPRQVNLSAGSSVLSFGCKVILDTGGRRLVGCSLSGAAGIYRVQIVAVVSSVPKEIPDWVFSGQVKSQ